MSEQQFAAVAEAAIQTIIDEQEFDPQAQTAYRIASSYPLEIWEERLPNLSCHQELLGPELLFSITAPVPLKRRRQPKQIVRNLNPSQWGLTSPLVEVFPTVIPAEIWAFCRHHLSNALNIKLALANGSRGWLGAG